MPYMSFLLVAPNSILSPISGYILWYKHSAAFEEAHAKFSCSKKKMAEPFDSAMLLLPPQAGKTCNPVGLIISGYAARDRIFAPSRSFLARSAGKSMMKVVPLPTPESI